MANFHQLSRAKFGKNCIINNTISIFREVINLYIFYRLHLWSREFNTDFTLDNCLFAAMSLTKTDPDKYGYRDYESKRFSADSKFSTNHGKYLVFKKDTKGDVNLVELKFQKPRR